MLDIEPIKARLAAATPGPWSPRHAGHGSHVTTGRYDVAWCGTTFGVDRNGTYGREGAGCVADAELIANAPADLAALIAEVERLRAAQAAVAEWDAERARAAALADV